MMKHVHKMTTAQRRTALAWALYGLSLALMISDAMHGSYADSRSIVGPLIGIVGIRLMYANRLSERR